MLRNDLDQIRVLVLNADFRPLSTHPLSTWDWKKAVEAVFKDRVAVIEYYDVEVRSPSTSMLVPAVIAKRQYVQPPRMAAFTRRNLYLRDRYSCQYCGARHHSSYLTFDHVQPLSRGGRTSWENIVASCGKCNFYKSNRYPHEAGMTLLRQPYVPSKFELDEIGKEFISETIHETWGSYLFDVS